LDVFSRPRRGRGQGQGCGGQAIRSSRPHTPGEAGRRALRRRLRGMTVNQRAFCMGNALVVDMVRKIGRVIAKDETLT